MKIVHSSNVELGKLFENRPVPGDRLRTGIKRAFSEIIDLTIRESADLLIFAGDTFDSLDVSQNLLNFFVSEIERLENTPAVVLPGSRDFHRKGDVWEEWAILPPTDNLHVLVNSETPYIELPQLPATVYGYPITAEPRQHGPLRSLKKPDESRYHIAVVYGNLADADSASQTNYPIDANEFSEAGFDYVALGGQPEFRDLTGSGLPGAYPGRPERISAEQGNAGYVAVVTLNEDGPSVVPVNVGSFVWREVEIAMDTIGGVEDLKKRIVEMAGPDTLLKVTLKGLTLLEAGINLRQLHQELKDEFLHLEFVDRMRLLPENVSEVKVHEKTILGQFLKVMVDKLNEESGANRNALEESLKVGYSLLSGRDIW